jgi:GTP-binding protein Era
MAQGAPQHNDDDDDRTPRAGRVVIVGRPNVGKSTLLNALLGQKLAIATEKPQTTRQRILGVYAQSDPPTQIALLDTPGLHRPKNALGRALVEEAQGALAETDVVLWLLESPTDRAGTPALAPADREVRELLATGSGPALIVALNKVDRLKDKTKLLPWLTFYQQELTPAAIVPISALKQRGTKQLLAELRKQLPAGVLYDDPDFITDRPERFFVAELVREAAIRNTRNEVPYAIAVLIDSFEEASDSLTRIGATVVVEKENHKKIVVGAGGSMLKRIGSEARKEIEALLGRKVNLGLFVKVVPNWTEDPASVRRLALESSP